VRVRVEQRATMRMLFAALIRQFFCYPKVCAELTRSCFFIPLRTPICLFYGCYFPLYAVALFSGYCCQHLSLQRY